MRRAYTYIIVGFFFIFLSITINEIDLLHDSIGYLLIVLGVIEGERQRPIQEFIQAKYLGIALGIYALIQPFLFSNQSLNNSSALVCLTLIASLASIYMYYSLLKAEYIWHPSKQTRQYVDTYLVLAITSFAANCLTYLIPIFAFIAILIEIAQSIYLIYVFLRLRAQYED